MHRDASRHMIISTCIYTPTLLCLLFLIPPPVSSFLYLPLSILIGDTLPHLPEITKGRKRTQSEVQQTATKTRVSTQLLIVKGKLVKQHCCVPNAQRACALWLLHVTDEVDRELHIGTAAKVAV